MNHYYRTFDRLVGIIIVVMVLSTVLAQLPL